VVGFQREINAYHHQCITSIETLHTKRLIVGDKIKLENYDKTNRQRYFGFVKKVKSLMSIFRASMSFCSLTPTIGSLQFGHS
jgi:hypothetical protein